MCVTMNKGTRFPACLTLLSDCIRIDTIVGGQNLLKRENIISNNEPNTKAPIQGKS